MVQEDALKELERARKAAAKPAKDGGKVVPQKMCVVSPQLEHSHSDHKPSLLLFHIVVAHVVVGMMDA